MTGPKRNISKPARYRDPSPETSENSDSSEGETPPPSPPPKKIFPRKSKISQESQVEEGEKFLPPRKSKRKAKTSKSLPSEEEAEDYQPLTPHNSPQKKRKLKAQQVQQSEEEEDEEEEDEEDEEDVEEVSEPSKKRQKTSCAISTRSRIRNKTEKLDREEGLKVVTNGKKKTRSKTTTEIISVDEGPGE